MILFWIAVFLLSLIAVVKGADWFLKGAENIGLSLGLSPFIVGVTIVATGTSLPELISSLFAVKDGVSDIVAGNVVGSNIANIFLILGMSTIIGRKLVIDKDLINLDLPLLAVTTGLFIAVAWDRVITFPEGVILLLGHVVYFLYTIFYKEESPISSQDILGENQEQTPALEKIGAQKKQLFSFTSLGLIIIGSIGLIFGAQYLIDAVIQLSIIWNIAPGIIAISAVAIGTSLPELLVSGIAAWRGNAEVALGNILGSNIFNILVVLGIPSLITTLRLDDQTYFIGLPYLIIATVLFIISGISRKIHHWEGWFLLLLYIMFIAKLFAIF